jgi:DNA uptake protein ComE-like DNA-binding protein
MGAVLGAVVLGAVLFGQPSSWAAGREPPRAARSIPLPEARVDINHASIDELMKVPGMTRTWAGRIVRFRPYRAKSDLLERGVLPGDVYSRIQDDLIAHRDKFSGAARPQAARQADEMPEARVDINHASVDELMKVPGMTRGLAERIVRLRPYRSKRDLLQRGIVTSQGYGRIKDYVIAHRQKR